MIPSYSASHTPPRFGKIARIYVEHNGKLYPGKQVPAVKMETSQPDQLRKNGRPLWNELQHVEDVRNGFIVTSTESDDMFLLTGPDKERHKKRNFRKEGLNNALTDYAQAQAKTGHTIDLYFNHVDYYPDGPKSHRLVRRLVPMLPVVKRARFFRRVDLVV